MLAYMPAPWILWVMKIGEALDLSMPWCRDLEEPQVECRNATIATVSFSTSNQGARLWKSSKILGLEGHMNRNRGFLKWEHPNSWMVYSILMLILKNPWRSLFSNGWFGSSPRKPPNVLSISQGMKLVVTSEMEKVRTRWGKWWKITRQAKYNIYICMIIHVDR